MGRTIRLDGEPYQVIGVMPADLPKAGAGGVEWSRVSTEFWIPFGLRNDELVPYGDFDYECIGRLRPGVPVSQAMAELNAIQARIAASIRMKVDLEAVVTPLQEEITKRSRRALLLLFAAIGTVLLVGCVNVDASMISADSR